MSIQPSSLLAALSADRAVSGSELADRLGVTRAAVWKQIESLRKLGAPIAAEAGSGYRLQWPFEPLDRAGLLRSIDPALRRRLGDVRFEWQIESTNTALLDAAAGGAPDLSLSVAETQTGGRGRRGRAWQSPLGGNVYFSLLRRFASGMAGLSGLSIVSGIAVLHALEKCGVQGSLLKWPNDIVADGRKLAGVLVEIGGEFLGPCFAVIGIGINLRLPDTADIDQPYTDLTRICGDTAPSRNRLLAHLLQQLVAATDEFSRTGFASFAPEFARHDALADTPVMVHSGGAAREGIAHGVDPRGALRVRHADKIIAYDSAEVTVRAT